MNERSDELPVGKTLGKNVGRGILRILKPLALLFGCLLFIVGIAPESRLIDASEQVAEIETEIEDERPGKRFLGKELQTAPRAYWGIQEALAYFDIADPNTVGTKPKRVGLTYKIEPSKFVTS